MDEWHPLSNLLRAWQRRKMMNNDTIISLASTVIALSAFGLSIYQVSSLKKHNRLSVKPRLEFNYHSDQGQKVMLHLTNGGLGPAILKSINVELNGHLTEIDEKFWNSLVEEFNEGIEKWCYYLSGTDILRVGEERELLRIEPKKPQLTLSCELERKIDGLRFIVTYESLYGETYTAISSTHRRAKYQ